MGTLRAVKEGITPAEALRCVLEATRALGSEVVASREAQGRVLAEAVVSARRLPPADNSAMDGYAVRCADVAGACAERAVELPIAFEVAAGSVTETALAPGSAARIFTGAPLPPGADAVVRQEDTERDGVRVKIFVVPQPRRTHGEEGTELELHADGATAEL